MNLGRKGQLSGIVDSIVGDDFQEPFLQESDIREMADRINPDEWTVYPLARIVDESVNCFPSFYGLDVDNEEALLMSEDLANRLLKRFEQYRGRKIVMMESKTRGFYCYKFQ